jgi:undecaprenyl diphosphate synthase
MTYTPIQARPSLPAELDAALLPRHVAMIMDGNGRWAEQRKMPRTVGHSQGARTLKKLLQCCDDWGIEALTVYAFSSENWRRPVDEVNFLMDLFERMLRQELNAMHEKGVKLTFLGDLSGLPISVARVMEGAIELTQHNRGIAFNVAMNYGGRQEIINTCQALAQQVQSGQLHPNDIDETLFQRNISTLPDPDLLIRTSGELRLSNFLLWQLAYTELYFTDTLWVDFDAAEFQKALLVYQGRQRRFGGLNA